jgi:hypothetical protein
MAELKLSFDASGAGHELHNLGNIADDVWREMLTLHHGCIIRERYIATMAIVPARPLRKKERDELERRLAALARRRPTLDPQILDDVET